MRPDFSHKIPIGDTKLRRTCNICNFIDYVNPKIVTGCIVTLDEKILLCKRAIEPRSGFWTLPAGFLEEGESVEAGAMRETLEEANAKIEIDRLLAVYSVPRISQVQIMYRAKLISDFSPGPESLEVALFDWKDIPWQDLAFPTVIWALTHYAKTRHLQDFAPFSNPPGTERLTL